jgi:Zn-dependent oligopeptidase
MGAVLGGLSLLGSIYAGNKGYQAMQGGYDPYDINALRNEQQPMMDSYSGLAGQGQDMYGRGVEQYNQGQGYLDVNSEQNQLLRGNIQKDALSGVALQNTLAQRNPNANSGILNQQLSQNQQGAMKSAQGSFLQGFQNNQNLGMGLMGQAINQQTSGMSTQMGAYGAQTGMMENMQQAMIANTDMGNQQSRDEASYWSNMSGSLMSGIGSFL